MLKAVFYAMRTQFIQCVAVVPSPRTEKSNRRQVSQGLFSIPRRGPSRRSRGAGPILLATLCRQRVSALIDNNSAPSISLPLIKRVAGISALAHERSFFGGAGQGTKRCGKSGRRGELVRESSLRRIIALPNRPGSSVVLETPIRRECRQTYANFDTG